MVAADQLLGRAVTAVHDGYALAKSVSRGPLGGALLSRCMLASLGARGTPLRPPYAFRRVQGPPPACQWEVRVPVLCACHTGGGQFLLREQGALRRCQPKVLLTWHGMATPCLHTWQWLGSAIDQVLMVAISSTLR